METGIDLIAPSKVDPVSAGPPFTLTLDGGRELKADAIVVAAGRIGNTDSLALENAGLSADARGFLAVNEAFQTAQPHIYAAGDVIGFRARLQLDGAGPAWRWSMRSILKYKQQAPSLLPYGIYTIPECAIVGEDRRFRATAGHASRRRTGPLPQQRPRRRHR